MKPKNKTLIIFSPAFPADEADSVWLPWLQTLVIAFNRNYAELTVIIFAFQYPHSTKIYQWNKNKVIPFNGMHKNKLQRIKIWLTIFFGVKKIRKQFDVVGIFSMWCGECTFVAKHVAKFFNLKHLCWILGQDARKSNTLVKRIRPKASSLVAMSDFLVDEFYTNHKIKPQHVIPNGIDVALFDAVLSEKDIDIIGAGSLSTLKQYNIFVEMIALLKQQHPNIKAILCGDGEESDNIKKQVKELGLENNITLTGKVDHHTILQTMQRAKILLHPSSYEGFGTVCIEALYAGAHVISFVKAMNEPIKNWHIVNSTQEMHSKASEILQNKNNNYERVLFYTMDDAAKNVLKLFRYQSTV